MSTRRLAIIAALAATLLGVSVPAWAYFTANDTSAISAGAVSLTPVPAGTVTVTVTDANDATVSWTNPTNPAGTTYVVTANGQPFCSTTSNSCSHDGLTAGTSYAFAVQPTIGTAWSAQATMGSASTPTLGLTLAPLNFTALPATETGTLTGFPAASALSWHLDSATGASLSGTNTLPAGNAVSVTIPAGTSTGTHTVYVTSGGFTASTTVTYTPAGPTLVVISTAVSGATSSTPNLGAITVQRQDGSGSPVASNVVLTVALTSSSVGGTFGAIQFAGSTFTTVSIPKNASTATFYYGDTSVGTPTITATASGYAAATQQESITTAPAGLAVSITDGTGTPALSCTSVSTNYSCDITGVGGGGSATFTVSFVAGVVYSTTQSSLITETGPTNGSVTIAAGQSDSGSGKLTASTNGQSTQSTSLTFGPYTLTLKVHGKS